MQLDCHPLSERLGREPGLVAAWLHGSGAKGRLRADSDVDLALLYANGAGPGWEAMGRLASDLEEAVGYPVDLGLLHTGNLTYAREAIAGGRQVHCADPVATAAFVGLVLGMYFDFKRARMEIEEAYAAG